MLAGAWAWLAPAARHYCHRPVFAWGLTRVPCNHMQDQLFPEQMTSACSYVAYRQVFVPWAVLLFMAQIFWSGLRIVGGIWRGSAAPDGYNI